MDHYFVKIPGTSVGSTTTSSVASPDPNLNPIVDNIEFNSNDIESDPGRRKPIETFNTKIRDNIRRGYICNRPCQPIGHVFTKKQMGGYDGTSNMRGEFNGLKTLTFEKIQVLTTSIVFPTICN